MNRSGDKRICINLTGRRWRLVGLICVLMVLISGCKPDGFRGENSHGAIYSCSRYEVFPDSIELRSGVVIRAYGDSAIQVRVEGNTLRTILVAPSPKVMPTVRSASPLFDLLLRLEQNSPRYANYSPLTPLEIYLIPTDNPDARKMLMSRLKNGYIIPSETRRLSWPAINDNALWLLAASEIAKIETDPHWLEVVTNTARETTAFDRSIVYNPASGLIGGIPRYLSPLSTGLPEWMQADDLCETATLTVNASCYGALSAIESIAAEKSQRNEIVRIPPMGFDADSLMSAILTRLWEPAGGNFSAMLAGPAYAQLPLPVADNIGQSLAVLSGLCNDAMCRSVVSSTPMPEDGPTLFSPALPNLPTTASDPSLLRCVRALWSAACARSGDTKRYSDAAGVLIHDAGAAILEVPESAAAEIYQFNRPLTALLTRGMLGITYRSDGMSLSPSLPAGMSDTLAVEGWKWRKASLTICISGEGNRIESCTLDGVPSEPFIPSSLRGRHTVDIRMSRTEAPLSKKEKNKRALTVAEAPTVTWVTPAKAAISISEDQKISAFMPYINGVEMPSFDSPTFQLPSTGKAEWVQIASVMEDDAVSLPSAPHLYLPAGSFSLIPFTQNVKGGTKIIDDRKLASRFVESNKWKNRSVTFNVSVAEAGEYLIDIHYINGLGVVNSRRRTALRSLRVNGSMMGVFVFPQLSASGVDQKGDTPWQTLTSYTNPLRATLHEGENMVEIRYYQPSPVFVDPMANVVLADYLRIIKI